MNWTQRFAGLALAALAGLASAAADDYVDRSGTITSGGTSQTLAAADPGRGNITIYNLGTESEVLCVNVTSDASCTAAGSWQISPGGSLTLTSKEAITVVAATTGHKFTAKERVTGGFALVNPGSSSGGGGGLTDTQLRASAVPVSVSGVSTAANQTTQISHESRLTSSAGPKAPGSALATTAFMVGGTYNSGGVTLTNTQESGIQLDSAGNVKVAGSFSAADVSSFTGTCSSTCNGTTLVAWTTDGYQSAEIQVTSAGTGATFTWQCSSDNVTFSGCNATAPSSSGSSGVASASTGAVGQFCMPVYARYQRVQMTGYSSGTVTVVGYQRSKPNCGGVVAGVNVVNTVTTSTAGSVAQGGSAANPLVIGGEARTTTPTATTTGQVTRFQATTDGKQVTLVGGVPELSWTYAAASGGISNTTTAVTIKAAGTDRLYLSRLDLMCEALGTATEVAVRDGAGGTVLWRTKVGTGGLPLTAVNFATPLKGTAATLMEVVTLTASGTGACYFNAAGYDAK